MKILQVHNKYQIFGGEDIVVDMEFKSLSNLGCDVRQYIVHNDDIGGVFSKILTVFNLLYSFSSYFKIIKIIREFNPDVVHVHNIFPKISPSIFFACKSCGVPVVQTLHNYRLVCPGGILFRENINCEECIEQGLYKSVFYICYKQSRLGTLSVAIMLFFHRKINTWQKKVDKFILLSNFARKKIIFGNIPDDKIVIKPNYCSKIITRENKQFSDRADCCLFVGRLSVEKGILEVASKWPMNAPKLIIVGDGPLKNDLLSIIYEKNNIKYLGLKTKKEVIELMANSRSLVFPALSYEGFPMVIVEAMSQGLPISSFDFGSMSEILEYGECGGLSPLKDFESLIEKAIRMVDDSDIFNSFSKKCELVFEKYYTEEKNMELLLSIYDSVIIP